MDTISAKEYVYIILDRVRNFEKKAIKLLEAKGRFGQQAEA
jgi:hypothetical protein